MARKRHQKKARILLQQNRAKKKMLAMVDIKADKLSASSDSEPMYQCKECKKLFLTKHSCAEHLQVHQPEIKNGKRRIAKAMKKSLGYANNYGGAVGWSVQGGAPGLGKRS